MDACCQGTCLRFQQQLHSYGSYKDFQPRRRLSGVAFMSRQESGNKTRHVNGPLRLLLYSMCSGAADPAASRGLERRMMHLTASSVASTLSRASTPSPDLLLVEDGLHRYKIYFSSPSFRRSVGGHDPVIRSRTRNFLEIFSVGFHYSVSSRFTWAYLAFGYVGCGPLTMRTAARGSRW